MAYEKEGSRDLGPQGETRDPECRNLRHKTYKVDFHDPKTNFTPFSSVSNVDFAQINVS